MQKVKINPSLAVSVGSGGGSKTLSTLRGRYEALRELLNAEGGESAALDQAVQYFDLRDALADLLVKRFGLSESGAAKVSGDTIGNSPHGLHLRESEAAKNSEHFVIVEKGARRVAQAVLDGLPPGTSDKRALSTIRAKFGFAEPEKHPRTPVQSHEDTGDTEDGPGGDLETQDDAEDSFEPSDAE